MSLTNAQHILIRALYIETIQETQPRYYVWTKNTDYRTVDALYKAGYITSSCIRNGHVSNMMLTQEGYDYGYRHFGEEEDCKQQEDHSLSNGIYIKGSQQYKKELRARMYRPL